MMHLMSSVFLFDERRGVGSVRKRMRMSSLEDEVL